MHERRSRRRIRAAIPVDPLAELGEEDGAILDSIFYGSTNPIHTNVSNVTLAELERVRRAGLVIYWELVDDSEKLDLACWHVELTDLGLMLYPPRPHLSTG